MRAATLFSGIGAPEQARPDWQWLWHAEIEPFPAAVMAARHPGSINLGDVTANDFAERAERAGRPDVLVFGSPCQSFSVAGQRAGLACPRGNLALVALALVRRLRPSWFVFENVPGLLSSWSGAENGYDEDGEWESIESSDFAAFLGAVRECGYSGCWRVLDARYWHLAQRRERVFFVGSLGDWRGPAAVLSFAEGMRGYPEKGSQAGGDIAGTLGQGAGSGGGRTTDLDSQGAYIPVAHTLLAEGFDAGPDGTGRGTPLVATTVRARDSARGVDSDCTDTLVPVAYGGNTAGPIDVATAVNAHGGPCGRLDFESETFVAQAFHGRQDDPDISGSVTHPLDTDGHSIAVAFQDRFRGDDGRGYSRPPPVTDGIVGTLETVKPWNVATGMQVRRLTPRECERLQGFPDDFTAISWRGKPAADGPRYRAIGNSIAVPVLRWLLTRIEAQAALMEEEAA